MAETEAAENHEDEWGLTWYLQWGIYTSIPAWTHSQYSLAAAEPLGLKIPFHGTYLKWSQRLPVSTRIVIGYAMKWGILFWVWWKVNGNWDNNMIRISQWRESHCRTNTSIRRKKSIQKNWNVRITVWDPIRKVNHLSRIIWNKKIIREFTRSISSTRLASYYDG